MSYLSRVNHKIMLLDVHSIFILFGYVMTGLLAVLWWLYRGIVIRFEGCLRHIQKELNAFRLESADDRGDLRGRLGVVEGKIDILMHQVQEHAAEFKSVLPRVAVLEGDSGRKSSGRATP